MQNLNFLETELLDILFRDKNKNYGAYVLRKHYASRVKQALGLTILSLLLFYGLQFVLPKSEIPLAIHPPTFTQDGIKPIDNVEIIPTGQPEAAPVFDQPVKTIPTEIIDHTRVIKDPIDQQVIYDDPASTVPSDGMPTTNDPTLAGQGGNGESTLAPVNITSSGPAGPISTTSSTSIPDPTPLIMAKVMPEFPGGEDAMIEYLKSHMDYPKLAKNMGIEGTVHVEFVVNTSGNISNIKVLHGIGGGCDREAKRVVQSMPTWKPGMQDGHNVNVSFVLPVKFEL